MRATMKNTFLALLIFASASIASADGRYAVHPAVGGFSVTDLCDAGETFKTVRPALKCLGWKLENVIYDQSLGQEWKCEGWVRKVLKVSKYYRPIECPQGNSPPDCVESNEPKKYGNTFKVPIFEDQGEGGKVEVASTTFTIPACQ